MSGLFFFVCAYSGERLNLKKISKGNWTLAESQNFTVMTDLDTKSVISLVLDLERFAYYIPLIEGWNIKKNIPKVSILAIANEEKFSLLGASEKISGIYSHSPSGTFSIALIKDYNENELSFSLGRETLLHEYTHHLAAHRQAHTRLPLWYEEGLASYLSGIKYSDQHAWLGTLTLIDYQKITDSVGRDKERGMQIEDVMELDSIFSQIDQLTPEQVSSFYNKSSAIVHYLKSSHDKKMKTKMFLRTIKNKQNQALAFNKSFSITYSDLQNQSHQYLDKNQGIVQRINIGNIKELNEFNYSLSKTDKNHAERFIVKLLINMRLLDLSKNENILRTLKQKRHGEEGKKLYMSVMLDRQRYQDVFNAVSTETPNNHSAEVNAILGRANVKFAHAKRFYGDKTWKETLDKAALYYEEYLSKGGAIEAIIEELEKIALLIDDKLYDEKVLIHLSHYKNPQQLQTRALLHLRNSQYFDADIAFNLLSRHTNNATLLNTEIVTNLLQMYQRNNKMDTEKNQAVLRGEIPTTENMLSFSGHWLNGKISGEGTLKLKNGVILEGVFQDGFPTMGKITYPDNMHIIEYEGELLFGLRHGKGRTSYNDGSKHEGHYQYDYLHGDGVWVTPSGNRIHSTWVSGYQRQHDYQNRTSLIYTERRDNNSVKDFCINKELVIKSCE